MMAINRLAAYLVPDTSYRLLDGQINSIPGIILPLSTDEVMAKCVDPLPQCLRARCVHAHTVVWRGVSRRARVVKGMDWKPIVISRAGSCPADDAMCEGISSLGYWQKVNQSPTQTKPYNKGASCTCSRPCAFEGKKNRDKKTRKNLPHSKQTAKSTAARRPRPT